MKKIISLVLCAMLTVVCLGFAETTTTEDTYMSVSPVLPTLYVSSPSGLNLRAGADYSAAKLITLWLGEPVYVIETVGNFTHIICAYGEGYVASEGLSANRSKNMEMYLKMYVNLKTAGEKLNVRGIPYLPAEYANDPIDLINNGTKVTAINQYGSFVEVIYYDFYGTRHVGYVFENCLEKCTADEDFADELCHVCGGKLDGRCQIIHDEDGSVYAVCYDCYMVGACPVCGKYVYFDQTFAVKSGKPVHTWCLKETAETIYKNANPFAKHK